MGAHVDLRAYTAMQCTVCGKITHKHQVMCGNEVVMDAGPVPHGESVPFKPVEEGIDPVTEYYNVNIPKELRRLLQ